MSSFRTAVSMTAEGPTKRRTLDENYAERSSYPTRAFSPRQLPTDHVTAVPIRAYQCDQSSRMPFGCFRHPCPESFSFRFARLSIGAERSLSRIHVVALRASWTNSSRTPMLRSSKLKGKQTRFALNLLPYAHCSISVFQRQPDAARRNQ